VQVLVWNERGVDAVIVLDRKQEGREQVWGEEGLAVDACEDAHVHASEAPVQR